ncbi:MAG TPA: pyroglutamyl-peptidase I [Opitutaceae bacterium]|nr:pyroglutamyl-peptidase I [Opitutaceae bacterium]
MKTAAGKILLTGFEPFGGDSVNPTAEIVGRLHGMRIGRHEVVGVVLPCVFGDAVVRLKTALRRSAPQLVICLGQAGGRAEITPERVAINVDDARIPDNAGRQPVDVPVVRGGPAAYWSTLPVKAIVAALRKQNIPAAVSQTAGTFVCNHVFYSLMHALRRRRAVRAGFIHVPWLPTQGKPAMSLATLTKAIVLATEVAARTKQDIKTAGGRLH